MHSLVHVNGAVGVLGFERHQLNDAVLIPHLPFNPDRPIFQINSVPFEAETLNDARSAHATQEVSSLSVRSAEMLVHDGAFVSCKGYDTQPFVHHRFSNNLRVFAHAYL